MKAYKLSHILLSLALLILVVLVSRWVDMRWDLTDDKRYTLAPEAAGLVSHLEEEVVITSLLEGDVPSSFRLLKSYIDDYLFELKRYNPHIQIVYQDVLSGTPEEKEVFQKFLSEKGVVPIRRQVASDEEVNQNLLYPYLSIHTEDDITFVNLLESASIESTEEESLVDAQLAFESNLLRAIKKITRRSAPDIHVLGAKARLIAEGCTRDSRFSSYRYIASNASRLLSEVDSVDGVLCVVKKEDLPREDLLAIDVAASRGVPILWAIDKTDVTLDSLRTATASYLATAYEYRVEDYLFRSGVKISPTLIMDIQSSRIPQVVNSGSSASQSRMLPYPFHPVILTGDANPVHARLSTPLSTYFVSPIELLEYPRSVMKKPLLTSGAYSKLVPTPHLLDFGFMQKAPDPQEYNKGQQLISVELEGRVKPYFLNRLTQEDRNLLDSHQISYRTDSQYIHQIVISDADWLLPAGDRRRSFFPIGFNAYENQMYDANAQLLVNLLEYLVDGEELISLKEKVSSISYLDRQKLTEQSTWYYFILLGLPLIVLLFLYICYHQVRRRKYAL